MECKRCETRKIKDIDDGVLKNNHNYTSRYWDCENFCLLIRRGVYPCEYMDSWKKFEETKLPPKNTFYSKLNIKVISDQNYEKAKQV